LDKEVENPEEGLSDDGALEAYKGRKEQHSRAQPVARSVLREVQKKAKEERNWGRERGQTHKRGGHMSGCRREGGRDKILVEQRSSKTRPVKSKEQNIAVAVKEAKLFLQANSS
jgi:hypothetical protein